MAFVGRARALLEAGDVAAARAAASEARAVVPDAWEALYWEGRTALAAGDASGALALLEAAARGGGGQLAELPLWQGAALSRLGRKAEAFEELHRLFQKSPGLPRLDEELTAAASAQPARARELEAPLKQALEARRRLVELRTEVDRVPLEECGRRYVEMGKLHIGLKEPVGFELLLLAADLLPEDREALKLLLSGMTRNQDVFVRLRLLRRLLTLEPGEPAALREMAFVYTRLHVRLDEAKRLAEELGRVDPGPGACALLGEVLLARGERAEALRILEEGNRRHGADQALREVLDRARGAE
jgi:tetratricopeptide (TPR) repeat protein